MTDSTNSLDGTINIDVNPTTPTVVDETAYLSPSRFVFVIDTPELKNISYNCQTVNIPSITVNPVTVGNKQFEIKDPGDRISFDNFQARFIIDEKLENYSEIYRWMLQSVYNPSERDKYDFATEQPIKRDVTLLIYNNANIVSSRIKFIGSFPTSLSPIEFTTTNSDTQFLYADIVFAIDYYNIV